MRSLVALAASALVAVASLVAVPSVAAQEGPRIAHGAGRNLSSAIQVGNTYWLSGKLGANSETRAMTEGRTAAETRNIMESFREQLTELGLDFGDVVQTTIFMTDLSAFGEMNEVYRSYFESDPPARATVQVAGLVGGGMIEIAFVAVRTN